MVAYSDLSIGLMLFMFVIFGFIMTPVQEILSIQYSLAITQKLQMARINKVLEFETESDGEIELKDKKSDISLKDLSFSYKR